jgi:hypothetical protein
MIRILLEKFFNVFIDQGVQAHIFTEKGSDAYDVTILCPIFPDFIFYLLSKILIEIG